MSPLITAAYVPNHGADGDLNLDARYAAEAGRYLSCAFVWDETAEGKQFWQDVETRLTQLAENITYKKPEPVNLDDWRPANINPFLSSVAYWLARNRPEQLANLDKIARRMAKQPVDGGMRYYAKASKKEQEAGCNFVRFYSDYQLERYLPRIIEELTNA